MTQLKRWFLALLLCLPLAQLANVHADQVIYQPGPVPGTDVWLSSYYDYGSNYGVDDNKLQAGGWGDEYYFLIQFDLSSLPANATYAALRMVPYSAGGSSTLVGMYIDRVTGSWNEDTGWYNKPTAVNAGQLGAPTIGYWYGINITGTYNNWKNGVYSNYGFMFRPVGTNNQFSQFRSSDYSYALYRPKLVVTYNGANLRFPLQYNSWTPYTATISAVLDHSMTTGGGCADNIVVAYTGEMSASQYGQSYWNSSSESQSCPNDILYGFKNSTGTTFSINGQYNSPDPYGNNLFLFYDGHTGYDYPVPNGTTVYASADGVAWDDSSSNVGLGIKVVHPSGYDTYYLHLSSRATYNGQGVTKGMIIGYTGSGHLHLTVKKGTQRVDPYGWKGAWNTDPLKVDDKDNVCLWETCQ